MMFFIFRRIIQIIIMLAILSMVIFALVEIVPGDEVQMALGQYGTAERTEALRDHFGLNQPAHMRYLNWVSGVFRGDLGMSFSTGQPINTLIKQRIGNSLFLAITAMVIGIPLGIILGILAGLAVDKWPDHLISSITLALRSMPDFVSAAFLIMVFSLWLGLLPPASTISLSESPLDNFRYIVLPVLTIVMGMTAHILRMTRWNVAEVLRSAYVRTAVLKGLSTVRVVHKHVLRNALLPTITIIATSTGWMFGGLVIVESVFSYPGLGQLLLFAVNGLDAPLLMTTSLIIAGVTSISNLAADILQAYLNPKIRYK